MAVRGVGRFGSLIAGAVITFSVAMPALQAQTSAARRNLPAPTSEDSITVTGCLLLGPYGDYPVSKTIATTGSIMNAVAWKVEGSRDLLGHVLEKVEITGIMMPTPPNTLQTAGAARSDRTAGRDEGVSYRLRVSTITKIAGGCS
jgi:hypothetical protein